MTREQITKGMPLLLAAKTEFEAMAETARCAIHYCYDQEAKNRTLSPKDTPVSSGCAISGPRMCRMPRRCFAGMQSGTGIWRGGRSWLFIFSLRYSRQRPFRSPCMWRPRSCWKI